MSIVRTNFTAATEEARRIEIKEWLEANGTEYFDSVTIDENNVVVTCAIRGGGTLSFFETNVGDDPSYVKVVLKGGSNAYIRNTPPLAMPYGVVTSKGIMLMTTVGGAPIYYYPIFINKSQNGDIVMTTSARNGSNIQSIDFEKSPSIPSGEGFQFQLRQMTTFMPIVVNNAPSYAVGLYLTIQMQVGSETYTGQIIADGKNYFTDGVWALEE